MAPLLILQAITPFLPLITKAIDAKKSGKSVVDTLKASTGGTEAAQVGVIGALFLAYQDALACNPAVTFDSLSCVTHEHWGMLAVASVFSLTQLLRKAKAE